MKKFISATFTVMILLLVKGQSDCTTLQPNLPDFATTGELKYLDSHTDSSEDPADSRGLLIILPNLQFNCYGTILSWDGMIATTGNINTTQTHQLLPIYFQVWRPVVKRTFHLIGSDPFVFDSSDLITHQTGFKGGISFHNFMEKSDGISFQPGDVIGCFIPASAGIGFVFKNATNQHENDSTTDMTVLSVGELACEVSLCEESTTRVISHIIPLIRYEVLGSDHGDYGSGAGYDVECSNASLTVCPETRTRQSCNGDSSCAGTSHGSTIPGLFAVIASLCVLGSCILGVTAGTITICIAKSRRTSKGNKTSSSKDAEQEETNCIANEEVLLQTDPARISTLAEFLQYNIIQSEYRTESCRMSWV